jgi:hypothetical protein
LNCFAGCSVTAILSAVGLKLHDLFPGPPPSRAERRKAEAAKEAERSEARERNREVGKLADEVRWLHIAASSLGAKLATTADNDPVGDTLAQQYHAMLARLREAEGERA